jgi:Right handed beta helix region
MVTSSLGGGIVAALVVVTPSGGSALPSVRTTAGGGYTVPSVPDGSGAIALSDLPTGCNAPASASYSGLTNGATATVNFTVTCTPPVGTVTGTVTSSLGGQIPGATVTIKPTGGTALPSVTTGANGSYTVLHVPIGSGTGSVTVAQVPTNCTTATGSYTGLVAGMTVTANVAVTCQPTSTPVSACQTITAPGSYTLVSDINGAVANGNCITIDASNVSLDCGNHTIAANGTGATVSILAVQGVTINHCTITASGSGDIVALSGYGPQNVTITNSALNANAPGAVGLIFDNAAGLAVTNCTLDVTSQQYYSVYVYQTTGAAFSNDQINTNEGISLIANDVQNLTITNNTVLTSEAPYAIYLFKTQGAQVSKNHLTTYAGAAYPGGGDSYIQDSSSYVTFSGNVVAGTSGSADVVAIGGSHNTFRQNQIDGGWNGDRATEGTQGTDDGIELTAEDVDTVQANTITNVFDASVETASLVTNTVIVGNTFSSAGTAVGSYWETSWENNQVLDNTVSKVAFLFVFFYGGHHADTPPVTSIDFLNNTFAGNVYSDPLTPPGSPSMASVIMTLAGVGEGASGGLPLPSTLSNNVIANNTLPASQAGFYLLPTSAFVDGGGNTCDPTNPGNALSCSGTAASASSAGAMASLKGVLPPRRAFPSLPRLRLLPRSWTRPTNSHARARVTQR